MLAAQHRLRLPAEFSQVFRRGLRSASELMVVHAVPADPAQSPTQVGFVVSKAIGNAVVRNRVKRRMRALVAEHLSRFDHLDRVVVRALPRSANASFSELELALLRCLDQLNHRIANAKQ